jgi:hypothetical protein
VRVRFGGGCDRSEKVCGGCDRSWIPMGRSLLIRDRKLEFSGIFVGRFVVFFSGLEAERCPFK